MKVGQKYIKETDFDQYIGKKYNMLTIIDLYMDKRTPIAKCLCDCRNNVDIKLAQILSGNNKSCGCLGKSHKKNFGELRKKHGKTGTRLYRTWQVMRRRCNDLNFKDYPDYGGRGITVCDEWNNDYSAFEVWALSTGFDENKSFKECSIDRIDHNGNYTPDNCRWVDLTIQANNKRNNHWIEFNGESHTIAEWGRIINVDQDTIWERLNKNMPIEKVLYSGDLRHLRGKNHVTR